MNKDGQKNKNPNQSKNADLEKRGENDTSTVNSFGQHKFSKT